MAGYNGTLKFDTSMDVSGFQKGADSLGSILKGFSAFSLIEKGFQAITSSIDSAVKRYDTLQRFPKMMEQMGFSTEQAEASTEKLKGSLDGIPASLDSVVATTQQLTVLTSDLETATDTTIALNNAFFASGANAESASRGLDQYVKMLSTGKVNMVSWQTLQQTMGYALQKTAESFGYAGDAAQNQLYAALQNGDITFKDFNARIIGLTDGVGGFAEMARTASGGIGISWTSLQTAIVRGTADIVGAIDKGLGETRFKSISNVIDTMKAGVVSALKTIANVIGFLATRADFLVPAFLTLAAATTTYQVATKLATAAATAAGVAINGNISIIKLSAIATGLMTKAKAAMTAATTSATIALGMLTAGEITAAQAGTILTVKEAALAAIKGVLAGQIGLATAAQLVWNAVLAANPIGAVITAIVALVAAVAGLIAIFNSSSEAYKKEKEELKNLAEAHKEYRNQLESDAQAAQADINEKMAQIQANRTVIESLQRLIAANDAAGKNNAAAAATVSELNAAMDGLGLAYDETTNSLNMSSAELDAYLNNLAQVADYEYRQSEYNRLLKEQHMTQQQINYLEEKQLIYKQMLDDKQISQGQYNQQMRDSDKLLETLRETETQLGIDVAAAEKMKEDAISATADAAIKAQQIRNNEMRQVEALAMVYNLSVDDIIDSASRLAGGLSEFQDQLEHKFTKTGESIEDVARIWGTSSEAIRAEMKIQNIDLDKYHENKKKILEEYQKSVQAHTDTVVNSFKEIPAKYEMSANKMIKTLQTNRERYAEWQQVMTEISSKVSAETLAELEKLGPGALSALKEMMANGGQGLNEFDELIKSITGESADYVKGAWDDPGITNAPADALNQAAQNVSGNTALPDAMTTQMEAAKTAAETVDFSAVGKKIGDDILSGFNNTSINTAMNGIISTIKTGTKTISDTAKNMGNAVRLAFTTMGTQSATAVSTMMATITTVVNAQSKVVINTFNNVSDAIREAMTRAQTHAVNVTASMMRGISSTIMSQVSYIKSSMSSEGQAIGTNLAAGIEQGVRSRIETVRTAAANLVTQAITAAKAAADIHSPSKIMYWVGEMFSNGFIYAVNDSIRYAVEAVDNMINKTLHAVRGGIMAGINELEKDLTAHAKKLTSAAAGIQKELDKIAAEREKEQAKQKAADRKKDLDNLQKALNEAKAKRYKSAKERKQAILNAEQAINEAKDKYRREDAGSARKAREDELKAEQARVQQLQKIYDEIIDKYKKAKEEYIASYEKGLQDIASKRESFAKKLMDAGDLFTVTTRGRRESYQLNDLNKQSQELAAYGSRLAELIQRGLPDSVLDEIGSMSMKDAQNYMEALNRLSDREYKDYMAAWERKQAEADRVAAMFYARSERKMESEHNKNLANLNNQLIDSINQFHQDAYTAAKKAGYKNGEEYMKAMINGMKAARNGLGVVNRDTFQNSSLAGSTTTYTRNNNTNTTYTLGFDMDAAGLARYISPYIKAEATRTGASLVKG